DRRTPRGVRRRPLRALRHQRAVRHRIPARPLRLHRRRPRRHREPARRRPRRPLYRSDRAVQQRPRVAHARHRLDELADLRRPDPDPRVPARGPPRRANAGGRVRLSAGEVWQRRRDLGAVWWRGLGRLGLGRERFHSLRPWQQRLAKVALAGLIAFLLVLLVKILEHYFGVGRHSVLTFDASAYIAFLVVALLVVPEWTALPALPMRLVLPGAVAVAGLVGLIVGLATSNTRNGVISSLGTLIALVAPPWLASSGRRAVDTPILEKRMPVGRKVVPLAALALAITFPFYTSHMFTIPVFGEFPSVETAVNMLVFIMMALGLNVVVGYAGLLDLGYVAFYAIGAYTAAWFASLQFAGSKCPRAGFTTANCPVATVPNIDFSFGGIGVTPGSGGIHVSIWLLLILAGLLTALIGVIIGLPTLRLRGDYLAIVTL